MSQTSQITGKYHIRPRYTRLQINQVPFDSENDEESNSDCCTNDPLRFTAKSLMKLDIDEASSIVTFIRPRPFKVASKFKNSNYNTISRRLPACYENSHTAISPCRRSNSMFNLSSHHPDLKISCNFGLKKGSSFTGSDRLFIQKMSLSHLAIDHCESLWCNRVIESEQQLQDMLKKAASVVCHVLMLNAWRRRREKIGELLEAIRKLTQKIDHLQLQTIVLRRLLDADNKRVGQLGIEIQRARIHSENIIKEKTMLAEEKYILENENEKLKAVIEERIVKLENCKNEQLSTKNQLKSVEDQIIRNHEKLTKLREDKKFLLQKVSMNETVAAECNRRADQAETFAKDLRDKLEDQIRLITTLQDDKNKLGRELRDAEAEKIRLNECILAIDNADKASNLRAANLTIQLCDREAALRRIESAFNTQLIELEDLRQQTQQSRWCHTVLQIGGNILQIPRTILRTLLFLTST